MGILQMKTKENLCLKCLALSYNRIIYSSLTHLTIYNEFYSPITIEKNATEYEILFSIVKGNNFCGLHFITIQRWALLLKSTVNMWLIKYSLIFQFCIFITLTYLKKINKWWWWPLAIIIYVTYDKIIYKFDFFWWLDWISISIITIID